MTEALKVMTTAIREELLKQAEEIYFWDEADKSLFEPGDPQKLFGAECQLNDRFDLEKVAIAGLAALALLAEMTKRE